MANNLIGNCFYQPSTSDPGVGFPMYYWAQIDKGKLYLRNKADNAWKYVGSSDQNTLGLLSRQGGDMAAPLTGAHGILPLAGADTSGRAYLGGDPYVLQSEVDTKIASVTSRVQQTITNTGSGQLVGLGANVVRRMGYFLFKGFGFVGPIPLPKYPDGQQALESECIWMAWITAFNEDFGHSNRTSSAKCVEAAPRIYYLDAGQHNSSPDFNNPGPDNPVYVYDIRVDWMIIAFRGN